jgi:hypothetical protein
MRFHALFSNYIDRDARNEMDEMISELRALNSEQRESLYAAMGSDEEPLRSFVDKAEGS